MFPITAIAAATWEIRSRKDHLVAPTNRTAGSFFKNHVEPLNLDRSASVDQTFLERREEIRNVNPSFAAGLSLRRGAEDPLFAGSLIASAFIDHPAEFLPGSVHGRVRLGAAARTPSSTLVERLRAKCWQSLGGCGTP